MEVLHALIVRLSDCQSVCQSVCQFVCPVTVFCLLRQNYWADLAEILYTVWKLGPMDYIKISEACRVVEHLQRVDIIPPPSGGGPYSFIGMYIYICLRKVTSYIN